MNAFFIARQSIFLVFSVEKWRLDLNLPKTNILVTFENVFIGQSNLTNYKMINCDWWKDRSDSKFNIYVNLNTLKKFFFY